MVTVIDMTSRELLSCGNPEKEEIGCAVSLRESAELPTLALQEVALEQAQDQTKMPPDLAQISISQFLIQFD